MLSTKRVVGDIQTRSYDHDYTAELTRALIQKFQAYLKHFMDVEQKQTVSTFSLIREDLARCASWETAPDQQEIQQILSRISSCRQRLRDILKIHTETLAKVKRLDDDAIKGKRLLSQEAFKMEKVAKKEQKRGLAAAVVGGALSPFTFGISGVAGLAAAAECSRSSNNMMQDQRALRREIADVFPRFSQLVRCGIETMEGVTGLLTVLANEIEGISASQGKYRPLFLRKAVDVCRKLGVYITMTLYLAGQPLFSWSMTTTIQCKQCTHCLKPNEAFFVCQTCGDFVLCKSCYLTRTHRHPGSFTKHSKAQLVDHGFQKCDGCGMFIKTGTIYYCRYCPDFDLCERCKGREVFHPHHLYTAKIIRGGMLSYLEERRCDECESQSGVVFECLKCFRYNVCLDCKSSEGIHPHPLARISEDS